MTPQEIEEIDSLLFIEAISFRDFISRVNPHYQFYPHLDTLIDLLQQVADDHIKRLMVFMPPRHGKSELVSRLFPAYYLLQHPERWVALASFGAELAHSLSRNARDNYTRMDGQLKDDASAIKHWETGQGGGLWASGVGGPASGKGFNLGIIDDPIKDAGEAFSPVIQRRNEDWFNSVFWTRREPLNAVVVVHTRWGKNDLAGYILKSESEQAEQWHIVHYEAVKSDDRLEYPATCTIEPDDREIGEALAPERYPIEELDKIKSTVGPFFWNALYQQSPVERAGRVYHAFSLANIGPHSRDLDYSKADGYYHSHDFGAVNHVWGLWAKIEGNYYLIHEQQLPQGTTDSRAAAIKRVFVDKKIISGWGGAASENQYRVDFNKAGVKIRLPVVPKGIGPSELVEAQIRKANKLFESGQMIICSDMLMTIDQLDNCIRDENEGIINKASWHYLDGCIRYFAAGIGTGVFVG